MNNRYIKCGFINITIFLGVSALLACSPSPESPSQAQPVITPDDIILTWARERHGEHVYYPVQTFYGDFNGDMLDDALAWILYPSGGNSDFLDVALFRNEGGAITYYRSIDNVFGGDPRNVIFAQDRITLTTTMPKPGDPRCCPAGSDDWVIDTK